MIITIKNLQQQTFLIDVDPEKTVMQLKEQIHNEKGEDYPVEKQKLIYAGVILNDERTIESYNISSNKFLVVMIKRDLGLSQSTDNKQSSNSSTTTTTTTTVASAGSDSSTKKPSDSSSGTASASASASANKDSCQDKEKSSGNNADSTKTTATSKKDDGANKSSSNKDNSGQLSSTSTSVTGSASASASAASSGETRSSTGRSIESVLLTGEEYNRMVNSLMEMGYCKEIVERALQASFNNPERAVEYLICGIPSEAADAGLNAAEAAVAAEVAEVGDVLVPDAPEADADANEDPLEFLRSQPQFVQMRALIQQNPDLLNAVLQQIGLTNPALLQLITENQESFLNMLNEPIEGPNPLDSAFFASGISDRRGGSGSSGSGSRRTGADGAADGDSAGTGNGGGGDSSFLFQNRNASGASTDSINRASGARVGSGGGSGDGGIQQMVDRISDVIAGNDSNSGDRLRARAAGFAAALGQSEAGGARNEQNSGRTANRTGGSGGNASGGLPTIRLTPQDQAAIERLTALGFPEALVVQAYFACDKNETLAANFLLNTGLDD